MDKALSLPTTFFLPFKIDEDSQYEAETFKVLLSKTVVTTPVGDAVSPDDRTLVTDLVMTIDYLVIWIKVFKK